MTIPTKRELKHDFFFALVKILLSIAVTVPMKWELKRIKPHIAQCISDHIAVTIPTKRELKPEGTRNISYSFANCSDHLDEKGIET